MATAVNENSCRGAAFASATDTNQKVNMPQLDFNVISSTPFFACNMEMKKKYGYVYSNSPLLLLYLVM